VALEPRFCDLCGERFWPKAWHQRFCSAVHGELTRDVAGRVKYRGQHQRRRVWAGRVAPGWFGARAVRRAGSRRAGWAG
jgi:hypothetical protein